MRYLLSIVLVGYREIDGSQLALWIDGGIEFKAIVPSLPVCTKASCRFGYLVPISSNQLADVEHGTIHEPKWRIFHKQLVEDVHHPGKCLTALPYE